MVTIGREGNKESSGRRRGEGRERKLRDLAAETAAELSYGENFDVVFKLRGLRLSNEEIKVTMYAPPFTTHGYSMNQRLLVLDKDGVVRIARATHRVTVVTRLQRLLNPFIRHRARQASISQSRKMVSSGTRKSVVFRRLLYLCHFFRYSEGC